MKAEKKKYYITTPIYYPSGNWHLGHSYTTVACDAIARYKRMCGYDVFYLTGTDEHGQKIEDRAKAAGTTPKLFVDKLVESIQKLWKLLDISYDKYIRTTDDYHMAAVQKIFKTLYDKGDIYKSKYKGKYCKPCESFWTEAQLKENNCPDCGRKVIDSEEECYFFALSKYQDRVKDLLTKTDFLQPQTRVNEMVNNFIKDGLQDLAVSRTSFKWGIPVSFDKEHVVYVWVDALSNYITALGAFGEDKTLFDKYWPADLHMVGKEIVRFHTIIWPALLMALDLPLPKKVFGHGWLLFGGDKMSKSKGNVVDPFILCDRYGVDAVRYFLLREVPFGSDGVYTNEALITRINADLVNDLGNLVKRSLAMAKQYFDGKIDNGGLIDDMDKDFIALINSTKTSVDQEMEKLTINRALEEIFKLISRANKYIDETKPWVLNKEENSKPRLMMVMYNLLESIRVVAALAKPFLTHCPSKILSALGVEDITEFGSFLSYGYVKKYEIKEAEMLFPRLDLKKEIDALNAINAEASESGNGQNLKEKLADSCGKNGCESVKKEGNGMITIDEFFKTQLKVAVVTACEKVEKADKLLKLTLDVAGEVRTVVSGIAKSYTPEEMVGKSVVLVANLQPAKLKGIESQGMILCATSGDKVVLVSPEKAVESGGEVC